MTLLFQRKVSVCFFAILTLAATHTDHTKGVAITKTEKNRK